jgi:hypothetical protein
VHTFIKTLKWTLNPVYKWADDVILDNLPIEQTEILVSLVFELIVLRIDVAQNKEEDEVNNDFDMSNMRYYIYFSCLTSYWQIMFSTKSPFLDTDNINEIKGQMSKL